MKFLKFIYFTVVSITLSTGFLKAQTVSNNDVGLGSTGNRYTIGFSNPLFQGDSNVAVFDATFDLSSSVTFSNISYSLGDPFSIFQTDAGTVFDPSFVNLNAPVISNFQPSSNFSEPVAVPFYLGLWQGGTSFDNGRTFVAEPGDSYGWIELEYTLLSDNQLGLELVDSEISSPSGGIIVGTSDVLAAPEPSTYALVFAGFGLLAFCIRRKVA